MKLPSYLKNDKGKVIYKGTDELLFFVPESYFNNLASLEGSVVKLFGLFFYKQKSENKFNVFRYPSFFFTTPCDIQPKKDVKINHVDSMDYRVLVYRSGDTVINSTKTLKSIRHVEAFVDFVNSGRLPNMLPQHELGEFFNNNMKFNVGSYNVPANKIDLALSELCRHPTDPTIPYRLSKPTNPYAYKMINIRDLAKASSPFASLTSENWDEALIHAVQNKKYKPSPLEELYTK